MRSCPSATYRFPVAELATIPVPAEHAIARSSDRNLIERTVAKSNQEILSVPMEHWPDAAFSALLGIPRQTLAASPFDTPSGGTKVLAAEPLCYGWLLRDAHMVAREIPISPLWHRQEGQALRLQYVLPAAIRGSAYGDAFFAFRAPDFNAAGPSGAGKTI